MYMTKISSRSPVTVIKCNLNEAEALRDALVLAIEARKENGSSILVGTGVMLDKRFLEVRINTDTESGL